jgi:hypothetical protein
MYAWFVKHQDVISGFVSGIGKDLTGTADWTKDKISKKEFNQKVIF